MRLRPLILCSLILAAPASAQRLGERTATPEAMLAQMDSGGADDALREQIAAAAAHPLGAAENPVRVGGPDGERAYLARLRCADGSPPEIGAREEAGVGAFGSVVGAFPLQCVGASGVRIVMDRYHAEHVETRAPQGFTILPR